MIGAEPSLHVGQRLGPYEILNWIGRGGMAEVYRAMDTRLDRVVAVKVLGGHLRERPDRRQRLEREARAISSLNHPHICALFDVGEQDGALFLVMEYVAGETLAGRLARGPLAIDDVLRHATEIADALDHAHREGIVHRDLKPANIIVSPAGVKLLDFGLAKWNEPDLGEASDAGLTESASTESLTSEGVVLGTLPYMAPEQLEGGKADARSDIFAAGAVIYEMITGRRAFTGDSRAGLIASILEHEPPPFASEQRLRSRTGGTDISQPLLEHVVKRCLAKQPDERWQTSADVKRELRWIASGHAGIPTGRPASHRHGRRLLLAVGGAIALIAAVAIGAALAGRWRSSPAQAIRYPLAPEPGTIFLSGPAAPQFAVSPDGRWIAFAAGASSDQGALWVRGMGELAAKRLAGTDGARQLFWSPDSAAIGFFAQGSLKTVRLTGGAPAVTLAVAPEPEGGAWSANGQIVFAPIQRGGLMLVSDKGGPATPATWLDPARQETKHGWPSFLPDGRRFLYFAKSDLKERTGIYLQSLDSRAPAFVLASSLRASYTAPGYLLFGQEGTLMAQPFDPKRGVLSGEPMPAATGVAYANNGRMAFSVSDAGTLVYRAGGLGGTQASALQWIDRSGAPGPALGSMAQYGSVTASAHGARVVAARLLTSGWSLWLFDLARGTERQFVERAPATAAVWSSDGGTVAYVSQNESRKGEIVTQRINGVGGETSLLKTQESVSLSSWSRDGRFMLYTVLDPVTGWDVWTLPLFGDRKPAPYLRTPMSEGEAQFSPDANWVVYSSNRSGRMDVWAQRFPVTDRPPIRISADGGSHPVWRADGRELFYLNAENMLVAVDILGTGATFEFGAQHVLFKVAVSPGLSDHYVSEYAASPDGQRFLFKVPQKQDAPMTVVLNWTADLPKR
jgi:Tol biopolymer transport system component/tRNA A-37 threonylcarbamoyl transferase component Bud32